MVYCTLNDFIINFNIDDKYKKIILDFLVKSNEVENGKYELIDGIFANVMSYYAKENNNTFEAHKRYIDIQYILVGKEKMQIINNCKPSVLNEYDESKDIVKYFSKEFDIEVKVNSGEMCIFYPSDCHNPVIKINDGIIKKVVVKVPINLI